MIYTKGNIFMSFQTFHSTCPMFITKHNDTNVSSCEFWLTFQFVIYYGISPENCSIFTEAEFLIIDYNLGQQVVLFIWTLIYLHGYGFFCFQPNSRNVFTILHPSRGGTKLLTFPFRSYLHQQMLKWEFRQSNTLQQSDFCLRCFNGVLIL